MVEHLSWCGPEYPTGIQGQRIAIVGYSHHRAEHDEDADTFTQNVVHQVIDADDIPFFPDIRSYFGYTDSGEFWNRVLFFNFLPDCVGTTDQRYARGTTEQVQRAKARTLRLMREHRPQKMLVFTKKGWSEFPPTREKDAGKASSPLGSDFPGFTWGTYDADGQIVMAYGLRHPQWAKSELMKRAVNHVLAIPLVSA